MGSSARPEQAYRPENPFAKGGQTYRPNNPFAKPSENEALPPTPSRTESFLGGVLEGIPGGERALGWIGRMAGGDPQAIQRDIAAHTAAQKAAHPNYRTAGDLAGGAASFAALPEMSAVRGGAAYGALRNLLSANDETGWQRAKSTAVGSAVGAVGGKVGEIAGRGVLKAGGAVADAIAQRTGNRTAQAVADQIANRNVLGQLKKTLGSRAPADVAAESERLAPAELAGRGQDIAEAAGRTLAGTGNVNFTAARNAPVSSGIQAYLDSPEGAALWKEAQASAEKRGRALPTEKTVPEMPKQLEGMDPAKWAQMAAQKGWTTETPSADPEALHFMRNVLRKRGDWSGVEKLDAVIGQSAPELQHAIQDYAQRYRLFDILDDANHANRYLAPGSKAVPPHAVQPGEPGAIESTLEGFRGVQRQFDNMTPQEQQVWRSAARDRLAAVGAGDNLTPEWQQLLFGSPEGYAVWQAGQNAGPNGASGAATFLRSIKRGWVPHSVRGAVMKTGQAAMDAASTPGSIRAAGPLGVNEVTDLLSSSGKLAQLLRGFTGAGSAAAGLATNRPSQQP